MQAIKPLWGRFPPWDAAPPQPLWAAMPRLSQPAGAEPERDGGTVLASPFGTIFQTQIETVLGPDADPITDIFHSAVQAVRETDAEKVQMEYLMATGQLDNPALLTTALSKASLSVDLLVQLRNRALDAYNELTRISL